MIPNFKNNQARDSAIIYNSTWEQIKKLYEKSPEQAGELAIAAIELALTGEISSDDFMIDLLLENIKVVNERNKVKFDKKTEANKQKRISEQQLDIIASYYLQGMKQKDIATKLGTTPQTISNRLATIRTDYPELLQKNQENQVNQVNPIDDNVNDNDNDNDNKGNICASRTNISGLCCADAQPTRLLSPQEEKRLQHERFKKELGF